MIGLTSRPFLRGLRVMLKGISMTDDDDDHQHHNGGDNNIVAEEQQSQSQLYTLLNKYETSVTTAEQNA